MSFAKVHDLHKGHVHYNMYTIGNSLSKVAQVTFATGLEFIIIHKKKSSTKPGFLGPVRVYRDYLGLQPFHMKPVSLGVF